MMLKPSIDTLLDKVPSKYSLVILEAKRAHELEAGATPTQDFKSVKSTLRALEEIESGNVTIHPDPEGKREKNACVRKRKSVKLKNKSLKKKKKAKRFKIGGTQSSFFYSSYFFGIIERRIFFCN